MAERPDVGQRPDDKRNGLRAPQVVTDAFSSKRVRHTVVAGHASVGHRLVCRTGYWVEARRVAYHWLRNGHRVSGATQPTYLVRPRDAGHDVSCTVTASNASNASTQHTVLTGAPVHVP